ncbi:GGDEF domain-containing protein [Legionella brunensis]|nr:GGDEF domain-containing protein [Legionella brunensis]
MIQQESFLLLLQSSTKAIPFNIFLSAIIWGYLLYRGAPINTATYWFLAITVLSITRLLYSWQCITKKKYISSRNTTIYLYTFICLTFFMGGLWGLCYIFFYSYFSEMHHNVITLVLGGMASGGLASLSIYLPAYYAYLLPMFLPLIIYNVSFLDLDKSILAVMFILFVIMLMITAKVPSQLLHETIILGKEKDKLIDKLNKANNAKDAAIDEINRISITDSLTGLYNRRYFDKRLSEELRRAKRINHDFNLILIDVDNFKSINDNFGHPYGDIFLKKLAMALEKTTVRANDATFRIGGDEFAAIIVNSSLKETISLCERIQARFKRYTTEQSSLSIGVVSVPPIPSDVEKVISAADKMLYLAKKSGKNKIHSEKYNG